MFKRIKFLPLLTSILIVSSCSSDASGNSPVITPTTVLVEATPDELVEATEDDDSLDENPLDSEE